MRIKLIAHFEKGLVGDPYWPEQEKVINILKESGAKRVRSREKAEKALSDYLQQLDMKMEDFHKLERLAARPFYTLDGTTEIVISEHQLYGMLAQACQLATSAVRLTRAEQVRTLLTTTDWRTGKVEADGVWSRFVVVTGAQGKLSNQRALRENAYIAGFDATGEMAFSEEMLEPEKVKRFLVFCGREVGVGASRKLGWGRFEVTGWEQV